MPDVRGLRQGKACGLCCTRIENFSVTLNHVEILRNVNLHIHCGELTALIGPNGGGKTTLLRAMLDEIPHRGNIRFLDAKGHRSGKPLIGYVPQRLNFDSGAPVSVRDLFAASRSRIPVWFAHSHRLVQQARDGLAHFQAEKLLNRRVGDLSGGELQRVLMALALEPLPDLLLMDEPVAGVDHKGMELFYRLVADLRQHYDLAVILVSHDLDLVARYADRVVYLNKTVQCTGKPAEVFENRNVVQALSVGQWDAALVNRQFPQNGGVTQQ